MKICPTSLIIRGMQIKTKVYYRSTGMAKVKNRKTNHTSVGEGDERLELIYIAGRNAKWYRYFGKQFDSFL